MTRRSCNSFLTAASDWFCKHLLIVSICCSLATCLYDEKLSTSKNWVKNAQKTVLKKVQNIEQNLGVAKNVIIFLGDGMSIPTLTAARIHLEQRAQQTGENNVLEMDTFPFAGLSKTYCADSQVADSACSATAYLTGVKANFRTIGVTDSVKLFDCKAAADAKNQVASIAKWAQDAGKLTGIVTNTRVTHASPSGNYAHTSHRKLESDFDIQKFAMNISNIEDCVDIAKQLITEEPGRSFNVIMGGGRSKFLSNSSNRRKGLRASKGVRLDERNLIREWREAKKKYNGTYVTNRRELMNVNLSDTQYLLGLFADSHMKYNLENTDRSEPSLWEMTESAIKILQKGIKGFYLFVEGGKIDMAHHRTWSRKALDETIEFSKAIRIAKKLTSSKDTLIVVTADHSHTMSISGYSDIENDILDLNSQKSSEDGLPYATLSYANGPDVKRLPNGQRKSLSNDDFSDDKYEYPSNVPMKSETHGGDDVAVFASGPWSSLFTGVYEQNAIPHLAGFAACIGNDETNNRNCFKQRYSLKTD